LHGLRAEAARVVGKEKAAPCLASLCDGRGFGEGEKGKSIEIVEVESWIGSW